MKILYNAKIHTLDPKQPNASALAIENDKIIAIGSDEDILALATSKSQKINLNGKVILPGLTDAHFHLQYYAFFLQQVNSETDTLQECLERVAARAKTTPPGEWILGHGWNQNTWKEGFGTAQDLDRVAPNHPVFLTAKSGHAGWANTMALQKANITAATPDPGGGKIVCDSAGQPSGILLEEAMQLVYQIIPETSDQLAAQAIGNAQKSLWQVGLTGLHDFDRRQCFVALQLLHQQNQLGLRILKSIPLNDLPFAIGVGLRTGFGDNLLRIGSIKCFVDGALGPQTAAMIQPYENSTETGILLADAEQIFEYGQKATLNGLSLAIHAIGDRANHEVLEAYTQLRKFEKEKSLPQLRHRIEHVQILHPNDVKRLAQHAIIASMQPIHATSDMLIADHHWGKRSSTAYALRTLVDLGTPTAFGSDAPVESPNPFIGLHAAVTRRRADGTPGPDGWYPEQRLTLQQALYGFTAGAAYAAGMENCLGKLAAGFLADLIVLDRDPFQIPPHDLQYLKPQSTMVGGEWVWQS